MTNGIIVMHALCGPFGVPAVISEEIIMGSGTPWIQRKSVLTFLNRQYTILVL